MITLRNIRKTFKVAQRDPGFANAVRAMFKRQYRYVHALDGVSFDIADGEMVGYIGPNGAGKSTTIKVMSGILTPDGGECVVDGRTPWKQRKAHVARIGVVFGQRTSLWWDVPVIDSFTLLKDIYTIPDDVYNRNVAQLTELLDLTELLRTPTRQLSLGQRMRCEIAAALLHNPSILFLDEPTIGLDAVSKLQVRAIIKALNASRGVTVILTTHDMSDIEALCTRIMLIGNGAILYDGALDTLRQRYASRTTITAQYEGTLTIPDGLYATDAVQPDGRAILRIDPDAVSVGAAVSKLSAVNSITDIHVASASAEEMVVELYRELKL